MRRSELALHLTFSQGTRQDVGALAGLEALA